MDVVALFGARRPLRALQAAIRAEVSKVAGLRGLTSTSARSWSRSGAQG